MPDPIKITKPVIQLKDQFLLKDLKVQPAVLKMQTLKVKPQVFTATSLSHKLPTELLKLHLKAVKKEQLKVPYTEVSPPTASIFYQTNDTKTPKVYVPEYQVGIDTIDNKSQFKVELKEHPQGDGGTLKVILHKSAPEVLKRNLGNAQPTSVNCQLFLTFTVNGAIKNIPFKKVKKTTIGIEATATVNTFNEYSQLYAAISDGSYRCKLRIHRALSIGVPQPVTSKPEAVPNKLKPIIRLIDARIKRLPLVKIMLYRVSVDNWKDYPDGMFKTVLHPRTRKKQANITAIISDGRKVLKTLKILNKKQLSRLSFQVNTVKKVSKLQVTLRDQRANKIYKSDLTDLKKKPKATTTTVTQPVQQLYSVQFKTFNQELDFHFPDNLHTYIYGNTRNVQGVSNGFKPYRIIWQEAGRSFLYLQEEVNPKSFFFIPDYYTVARKEVPLYEPLINVNLSGKTLEELNAIVSFEAVSQTDSRRFQDAIQQLSSQTGIPSGDLIFSPLSVNSDHLKLMLSYPGSGVLEHRVGASTYLDKITDVLPAFSLDNFQTLLDNLTNQTSSSSLIHGHVEIDIPNIQIEPIPLSLKLDQVEDEMLAIEEVEQLTFECTIENNESVTLSVDAAQVSISERPARFENLDFPLTISAGAARTVLISFEEEVVLEDVPQLEIEWLGMRAQKENGLFEASDSIFHNSSLISKPSNVIQVTNLIESEILFNSITAFFTNGNVPIMIPLRTGTQPVKIASGKSIYVDFPAGISSVEEFVPVYNGLKALPNKELLFETIVDTTVNNDYDVDIPVRSFLDFSSPENDLRLIEIEFKNQPEGPLLDAVIFTKTDLNEVGFIEKKASIKLPLKDYILNLSSSGVYWYRISKIVKNQGTENETLQIAGEWKSHSGSLEITSEKLPV